MATVDGTRVDADEDVEEEEAEEHDDEEAEEVDDDVVGS